MEKVKFEVPKEIGLSEMEEKGMQAMAEFIVKQVEEKEKGFITNSLLAESITKALDGFASEYGFTKEKFKQMDDALKEQGIELKIIKEKGHAVPKTLSDAVKELITKENIDAVRRANGSNYMANVETKAVGTIMTPNASTNAPLALSQSLVPGIDSVPLTPPAILAALNKGRTTSRTLFWINRIDKEGGSAFIAEGVLKPLKDWEYKQEFSVVKKIAVATKVSSEMLNDFSAADFEAEIRMMLATDLFDVLDEKLLNGAGGDEPIGILTVAGGYLGTGLDGTVTLPNNADAIRACMLQMALLNYKPDIVFMNPTDITSIALTKATDGNYISVQVENVIRPLRVIETSRIEAGKFLLMDSRRWVIRILEDFMLAFGWENDDFRRNLITIIAELRLHSYFNSIHEGAMIYEEFDVVKTAIEAP